VDTYNIEQGIRNAVEVAGPELGAIRLDSGDPMVEIPAARALLDELGAKNTRIIFSGDLDYDVVTKIAEAGLPCDGFGIGSAVVTGDGHPNCGFVYKLVSMEYEDGKMHPVAKKASGKGSVGGRKTVYRNFDDDWNINEEHLFTYDPDGTEVKGMVRVQEVFIENGRVVKLPTVLEARDRHATSVKTLPRGEVEVVIH
jgi:nicotinate phosphoribosyltransferase